MNDFFNARDQLKVGDKEYVMYRLDALEKAGLTTLKLLPFSIRVLLEAALRQCNDKEITQVDVKNIAAWTPKGVRPGIPLQESLAWWIWLRCGPRLPVLGVTRKRSIRLCL
jgi:aconitase A